MQRLQDTNTMEAETLALTLLAMRVIAILLLGATIFKQITQIRTTTTEYPGLRYGIFIATIILFIGQFIPLVLDAVVAFGSTYQGRNINPTTLPVIYSINNAVKDVIIGALLTFQHYRPRKIKS